MFKIPRNLKPDKSTGYLRVKIDNKWVLIHRLVLFRLLQIQ